MKTFSFKTRADNLDSFKTDEFDLLIIGGGITGAGAARDAASRGLKVALIEMQDFAEGTSSRSSKLIHGGIRYLENLEFHLVFEALSERSKLFNIAPHLVHPLRFVIPIFESSRVGFFKMGLGMWLYDALSLFQAPEMHERLNAEDTLDRLPVLQQQGLRGSFVYSDAYMDDDRLVIETLRSANDLGAKCANFIKAEKPVFEEGKVRAVKCKDLISGDEIVVKAKHVISSVGPWTDELGSEFFPNWESIMRPSKGIHLTFSRDKLPLKQAIVMGVEERIVFGIPRHEMVIVGTTDTDYKDKLENVHSDIDDVEYLLQVANTYFPGASLKKSDIIASYSGVRPLVKDDSQSEGKTSREHLIFSHEKGMTFVAGGKYTTYRLMAEQIVDAAITQLPINIQANLGKTKTNAPLSLNVSEQKLQEAESKKLNWASQFHVSQAVVDHFIDRFGYEAKSILDKFSSHAHHLGSDFEKIWVIEAHHAIENSMCMSIKDFFVRRTPLVLANKTHGFALKALIIDVFKQKLSLTDTEAATQWSSFETHFTHEMGWRTP